MSHEMHALKWDCRHGLVTLDTSLTGQQREFSETIQLCSDELLALINNILDFSKIEAGRAVLEEKPLDLWATVNTATQIAAVPAREKI